MADTKIIGGANLSLDCAPKEPKHHDDCDCHVDGVTIGGKGTKHDPFEVIGEPIWPPFVANEPARRIYARKDGSDKHGKGTLKKPYRTLQRAIRDLPRQVAPGQRWVVDVTGIGVEVLPANYALPAIDSPFGLEYSYTFADGGIFPFNTQTAVEIIAIPQPATSVAPADRTINPGDLVGPGIVADPDTNLIEIHTSKSYPVDALKGLFVQSALNMSGTIWHNTNIGPGHDVIYLTCASFPDEITSPLWHDGTIWPLLALPATIVEPSATLLTNKNQADAIRGGLIFGGVGSMGFRGFKVMLDPSVPPPANSPTSFNTEVFGSRSLFFEACDMDGAGMFHGNGCNAFLGCVVHSGTWASSNPNCFVGSYMRDLAALNMGWDTQPVFQGLGFVVENCPAFGVRLAALTPGGRGPLGEIVLRNGVIKDAFEDFNYAQIAAPQNFPAPFVPGSLNPGMFPGITTPGHGILLRGGKASIDHVKIFNCAADGIHAEAAFGLVELKSVTGGSGGIVFGDIVDAPNGQGVGGGYGLSIEDGVQVRINDDEPVAGIPTSVAGVTADIHVGALPDLANWAANFFTLVPNNYFDVQLAGAAGVTAQGGGARLFKK